MDFTNHPLHDVATYSTIGVNKVNTIGSYTIEPITKLPNPIQRIADTNDAKIVDVLLQDCSLVIAPSYKNWFAKRFYKLDKNSVLAGLSLAQQEGKNAQKHFADLVNKAYGTTNA